MNSPWECPRCNTVNAAWSPQCFCKMGSSSTHTESIIGRGEVTLPYVAIDTVERQESVKELIKKINGVERCTICNGYHGKNVQCMTMEVTCENYL